MSTDSHSQNNTQERSSKIEENGSGRISRSKFSLFSHDKGEKCESSFAYLRDLVRISTLTP